VGGWEDIVLWLLWIDSLSSGWDEGEGFLSSSVCMKDMLIYVDYFN